MEEKDYTKEFEEEGLEAIKNYLYLMHITDANVDNDFDQQAYAWVKSQGWILINKKWINIENLIEQVNK